MSDTLEEVIEELTSPYCKLSTCVKASWMLERLRENLQFALGQINALQAENDNQLGIEPQANALSWLLEEDPLCDLSEPDESESRISPDGLETDSLIDDAGPNVP